VVCTIGVISQIKPTTARTVTMMATDQMVPTNFTVLSNVIIFGYFKSLTIETKRLRLKRKILPVVAIALNLLTAIKMLNIG
jgi:hypothetical protein